MRLRYGESGRGQCSYQAKLGHEVEPVVHAAAARELAVAQLVNRDAGQADDLAGGRNRALRRDQGAVFLERKTNSTTIVSPASITLLIFTSRSDIASNIGLKRSRTPWPPR